jgi:methylglutamate dehydrogenase subunit D
MADRGLQSRSAFDDLSRGAVRSGSLEAGLRVSRRDGLGLAMVLARAGRTNVLRSCLNDHLGLELPNGPRCVRSEAFAAIGLAPDAWLLAAEASHAANFIDALTHTLDGVAAVVDQSAAYQVLRLSGLALSEVLAKGVALDFHPDAFGPDGAAVTLADHVNITLWRVDKAGRLTLDIAVPRSFFGDFWSWLTESAAAYGFTLSGEAL